MGELKLIIFGATNIDIFASGLTALPEAGLQENGSTISLGVGGKACNMARMSAALLPQGSVALMAKTVNDEAGLSQLLLRGLERVGVSRDLLIMSAPLAGELPTMALILGVNEEARRVLYFPGRNESLSTSDIDGVEGYLTQLARSQGLIILTGEMPAQTICYALDKAASLGIRVMVDPGGAHRMGDYSPLLDKPIYLLKPNALEAEQLGGIIIKDFSSARLAAKHLMAGGVQNVLMTHGEHGAYLFGSEGEQYFEAPQAKKIIETTGSGDQLMAVIAAGLLSGMPLNDAARMGVKAATLQCTHAGTPPLPWDAFQGS